jgi:hypothetical protein
MKVIILIFVSIFTISSTFSQSTTKNTLNGTWVSVYDDKDTLLLNFIDSTQCIASLGDNAIIGTYFYKSKHDSSNILLTLRPNKGIKVNYDYLILTMRKIDDKKFILKSVFKYFTDQPPESLLLENKIYYLNKIMSGG